MEKFNRDFGVPTVGADGATTYVFPSSQKAVVTSIVQAGEFVGALAAGPVGDKLGRRGAFFGAIFFLTLGTILQLIVAGSVPLLGTGRAFVGIGVGFLANSTPLYLSEISTAAIRGAVSNLLIVCSVDVSANDSNCSLGRRIVAAPSCHRTGESGRKTIQTHSSEQFA